MSLRTIIFWFLLTGSLSGNACWTEYNLQGMVQDARKLSPENLRWVIDKYHDSFEKGLQQRGVSYSTRQEYVDLIIRDSQSAVTAFTTGMSYEKGAEYLGRLARSISEMHQMLPESQQLSNPDWRTDYAIFLQKKRNHFRIRWKGSDNRPRDRSSLQKMLSSSNLKIDQVSKILAETLNRENKPIESYDLRSAPFGVGSIAYSNAVNTITLTWLYVWDRTGGIH